MPNNESSAEIDIAGITEVHRQWLRDLDAEVERIKTDPRAEIDTAAITAIRPRVKDLEAAIQRIRGARRKN